MKAVETLSLSWAGLDYNSKRAERSQEEAQRHWPRYCNFCALLLGQSLPCMLKLMLVRIQRLFRGCTGRTLSLMLRNICDGWFWLSSRMECICIDDTGGADVLYRLWWQVRQLSHSQSNPNRPASKSVCGATWECHSRTDYITCHQNRVSAGSKVTHSAFKKHAVSWIHKNWFLDQVNNTERFTSLFCLFTWYSGVLTTFSNSTNAACLL